METTELYLSGLGIVNEGLDWIIVVNDVSEGHWESLAAALPFVPAGLVKAGGHLSLRKVAGEVLDTLDTAGLATLKDVAVTGKLATIGTVYDDEGYSLFLRKVLSSDSGPIAIPIRRATLKDRMAAISPRPGGLFGWLKYEAHHDFHSSIKSGLPNMALMSTMRRMAVGRTKPTTRYGIKVPGEGHSMLGG
jgi:hypothetical protein